MKYILLFSIILYSAILYASDIRPKLFAKMGTPLYEASETFLSLKQIPSLELLIDEYITETQRTLEAGIKAEMSSSKHKKISYLKELRVLQKKYDKIIALSALELKQSMKKNDYEKFLQLINASMILYLENDSLSKKITTYYAQNRAKGNNSILENLIQNEKDIDIVYFERDAQGRNECNSKGNIWDNGKCLDVVYGNEKSRFGIDIVGSELFTRQITKALYLLKYKSYNNFLYVKKYLGKIKQTSIANGRRGIAVHENPPTWYANNVSVLSSLKWCAGVLVHEAHHSYLYSSYKKEHKTNNVPLHVYGEEEGEIACNAKQAEAMEDIGSSSSKIAWLLSSNGKHGDLNGDGKHYTKEDKALRAKLDLKRAKQLGITDDM